jgi:hypothetical protein
VKPVTVLLLLVVALIAAGCSSGDSNGVATPVDKAAKKDK